MQKERGERNKIVLIILIAGIVLFLDQLSKFYIKKSLAGGQLIPVWGNFFRITYLENPGVAFGLFPGQRLFFILVTSLIIILVFTFYQKVERADLWLRISLSLILGGALGNLIDRLWIGKVVDFLDFGFGPHRWPAFNLADSAISVGVGMLLIKILKRKVK
jgi:signal peptidase II